MDKIYTLVDLSLVRCKLFSNPIPNPNQVDKIYTLVGDILIAINPFKWIPGLYGVEVTP